MRSEKDIAERLRDAYARTGGNAVCDPFVLQIAREIAAVGRAEPEPAPVEPMDVDTVSDVLAGHISVAHGFDNFSRRAIAAEIIRALDRDRGRHEPARAAGTPIPSLVGEVVEAARAYLVLTRTSADTRIKREFKAALSRFDTAPRYGVEEIARAIMVAADCGLTVEGERVLCDHRLASCRAEDCGCRRSARAVLSLLASGVPEDDRARIRNEALEEAAMIFDELAEIETTAAVRLEEDDEADDAGYHHDNARHAAASAVRIRSLKTKDV